MAGSFVITGTGTTKTEAVDTAIENYRMTIAANRGKHHGFDVEEIDVAEEPK